MRQQSEVRTTTTHHRQQRDCPTSRALTSWRSYGFSAQSVHPSRRWGRWPRWCFLPTQEKTNCSEAFTVERIGEWGLLPRMATKGIDNLNCISACPMIDCYVSSILNVCIRSTWSVPDLALQVFQWFTNCCCNLIIPMWNLTTVGIREGREGSMKDLTNVPCFTTTNC